ncbi:MAG: VOC family protein [Phycisphaeraceae bacterium]|nr:VOC family protein [Phycisphaeraceae bacterium]MCB9847398.1 VOC family protein [Phycisphaeraceae bacterium]
MFRRTTITRITALGALPALLAGCQAAQPVSEHDPAPYVAPFLMFIGDADAAMAYYTATIDNSEIVELTRFGPGEMGEPGKVKLAVFTLDGQRVLCTDSPPVHDFTFTPSMSLYVACADEDQIRRYYEAFMDGGQALMPLSNYGFSRSFAWVQDRFGVSWQLNLP